jgi:predicted patatin/cPLA2 family phospholipase
MSTRDLALTFAGGGNRAFYQLGLLNRWGDRLLGRACGVAACSAGACVVTFYLTGRQEEIADYWRERRGHVRKNLEWRRVLRGESPAPHGPIYREVLEFAFSRGGLERVRESPFPILVLAAAFPRLVPAGVAVATGIGAYQVEKAIRRRMIHPSFGRSLGFRPFVFDARECETAEELADLVIASSATPPFTPIGMFRGSRLLDGGMVDNAPAFVGDEIPGAARNLVLLTRPYPEGVTGRRGRRFYVAPSEPVPISRWDYTRPHLLDETIALGERDAERFGADLDAFLAPADPRGNSESAVSHPY